MFTSKGKVSHNRKFVTLLKMNYFLSCRISRCLFDFFALLECWALCSASPLLMVILCTFTMIETYLA